MYRKSIIVDAFFKDRFNTFKVCPPRIIWIRIKRHLNESKRNKNTLGKGKGQ